MSDVYNSSLTLSSITQSTCSISRAEWPVGTQARSVSRDTQPAKFSAIRSRDFLLSRTRHPDYRDAHSKRRRKSADLKVKVGECAETEPDFGRSRCSIRFVTRTAN